MSELIINENDVKAFEDHLRWEEKSKNTIDKYLRDIKAFWTYIGDSILSKKLAIEYKEKLLSQGYAFRSINSVIASINSFFIFLGLSQFKVKAIKEQRQVFCMEEKELTRDEYNRLVNTAKRKGNERLNLILQTLCGTGIRVSELQFITVEAVKKGEAVVCCKGKRRLIFIVKALRKKLLRYATEKKIKSGCIFITRNGQPINRTKYMARYEETLPNSRGQSRKSFSA